MKQNIASINGCYQHVIPASSVRHARKNNTRKWFIRKRNWIFPHFPMQRVFKAIFLSLLTITVRYPPSWTKQIKHLTSLQSYSPAVSIHVSCSIIHIGVNIGAQNLHILFCSIYVGWNRPYYVMLYWVIGPCLLFIPPFDSFLNYLKKIPWTRSIIGGPWIRSKMGVPRTPVPCFVLTRRGALCERSSVAAPYILPRAKSLLFCNKNAIIDKRIGNWIIFSQ